MVHRYTIYEDGSVVGPSGKKLKPVKNNCGYGRITLCYEGRRDLVFVHRLVAEAFLVNPAGKPFVNHKDGNKLNNHVENLEWCTCQENIQHAWDTGLNKSNADALKGIKWGSTSKYNNVTYDKSRDKWIASMKQGQKTLFQKRFKTEYEAAEYVNTMIDLLQLDRPRNIII